MFTISVFFCFSTFMQSKKKYIFIKTVRIPIVHYSSCQMYFFLKRNIFKTKNDLYLIYLANSLQYLFSFNLTERSFFVLFYSVTIMIEFMQLNQILFALL